MIFNQTVDIHDEFGNTTAVKVGDISLINYEYEANNGNLTRSTYGNGSYIENVYDSLDRVISVKYNGNAKYLWSYGADGNVGLHTDLVNNVKWQYQYDLGGNVISVNGNNGTSFNYTYGTDGNLRTDVVKVGDTSKGTTYNYTQKGILEKIAYGNASNLNYEYDGFKRTSKAYISKSNAERLSTVYTYLAAANEGETTDIVGSMTNSGNDWSQTLNYTYDANGNIETVSEGGTQKAKYYYDNLNQLIREDNAWLGKTIAYTYDNGGNIQLVEEYTLTSGALDGLTAINSYSYLYGDSNWKDKLTSYNGTSISYDMIGNPISYYNGTTFTWQDGRQLAGLTTASGDEILYTYNADGIRTSKTVNGVTTNYTLEGSNVVHETNGTDTLWYYYDEGGNLVSFELNGTSYYYVNNLQGDIIAITDDSGNKVVEYVYDSWGKLISTTGTLASTVGEKNPYRYRGYRYDTETDLYYLQSRYYDPEIGRFINADSYVDTGDTVLSTNMFAYCENNPINNYDPSGEDAIWLQYGGGAGTMGHTGLLVQSKNGFWYYWYWGMDGRSFGGVNLKGNYTKKSIQQALKKTKYKYRKSTITGIIYFLGDFSKSYSHLSGFSGKYNLFTNNCMQTCVNALLKGKFKYNDSYYKVALRLVKTLAIPNVAYRIMFNINVELHTKNIASSKWKKIKNKYLK